MEIVTLISAILATSAAATASIAMAVEYARARRPHAICWSISLALFAIASAILALGTIIGWSDILFRSYYMVGGVLVVPWMTLGAVWLFGSVKLGRIGIWTTVGLSAIVVVVSALMPVNVPGPELPELKQALIDAPFARALAVIANAGGTPIAIFLLLRASSTYRRKKVLPHKASGAIVISIGIAAAALGGVLAAVESVNYLAPSLAVGAVLIMAGFRMWSRTPRINKDMVEVPT